MNYLGIFNRDNATSNEHAKTSQSTEHKFLVPRALSYLSLGSERERDPDWVWSRVSRTKLILREESFFS